MGCGRRGFRRDRGGDGGVLTGLIHVSQVEATDPGRSYDPLAQAVLLASQDPLAEETKSRAPDPAGLIVREMACPSR